MALKKDIASARKHMNRDFAPSELQKDQTSFALNTNKQDSHEQGPKFNEPSNIKCTGFKPDYTVVGFKYDLLRERTFFFLANETTGCSEIGYIHSNVNFEDLIDVREVCGCNASAVVEEALENNDQIDSCEYVTLLSDYCQSLGSCNGCLNFSVDNPIFPDNVHIKQEKQGDVMYFTDGLTGNPPRYIKLDHLEDYTTLTDDCTGEVTQTCLQCDKMRMFPLFQKPCLFPEVIQDGGNLRAGMYEALIALSTSDGDNVSSCFSLTNPIAIHDKNNNILDQTNLDYQTNQAIKITVEDVDTTYEYYTIYVIYRNGLDSAVTYYKYGTYPSDNKSVTINTLVDKDRTDIETVISRKPYYKNVKGLAVANGYLFPYGLKGMRTINLQPVVNLLGSAVKWVTYQAKEDSYQDGVFISNYMSYMRDEVVPLAIKPVMDGGHELPLFHFIARPPLASEISDISTDDKNFLSITGSSPVCQDIDRTKVWQFLNTGQVLGNCTVPADSGIDTITEEREIVSDCVLKTGDNITVVDTVVSGSVVVPYGKTLVQYINENPSEIVSSLDPAWADIKDVIENPNDYPGDCTPSFGDNCGEPTLTDEVIFAIDVESEEEVISWDDFDTYERVSAPSACNTFKTDVDGNLVIDSTFVAAYMEPAETVYERSFIPSNMSCTSATALPLHTTPQTDNYNFLINMGELNGFTSLVLSQIVTATDANFTANLHANAIWFKVTFNGAPRKIVELSPTFCNNPDDNTGTKLRVSLFNSCSDATDIAAYGRIITNVATTNDANKFLDLDAADFPSGTAYIAIDSGMYSRTLASTDVSYTLKPPCGCFSIYRKEATFSTSVNFTNLTFGKKQEWTATCSFTYPNLNNCTAVPHKYGLFSYVESTEKYPCNDDLYDSSTLKIEPDNIPVTFRTEFEDYYVQGGSAAPTLDTNGYYVLTSEADFRDKPIRHYKFPDNKVIPFMSEYNNNPGDFKSSIIYPIGFFLSNEVINAFLDIAVQNGLLTVEERLKINRYEIFRGDRSVDKSIIAKGVLFDMYEYYDSTEAKYIQYSNYPLNSLSTDTLNDVGHPYAGLSNLRYTFHSPDIHFYKPTLPREVSIEGYVMGKSRTTFDEVKDHPTYVLLGDRAYTVATTLAIAESALEIVLQTTDWLIGATAGGTVPGSAAAIVIAIAVGATVATQLLFKVGEYRYKWLETFRNLGRPKNFAYYSATLGYYNHFLPNTVTDSLVRGTTVSQYMKPGNWVITDEVVGPAYTINNIDREDSAYLAFKPGYNVSYPSLYSSYDNGINASRQTWGGVGRSPEIVKNAASPYVSLKQYLPAQYGSINSVQWVHTNYCGRLAEDNTCGGIFGGDTYISRFSVKRKFPFFTTTAFGLAPLTPFKYSEYFNVNPTSLATTRYYLDYELDDDEYTLSTFVFPDNKSKFNLDGLGTTNKFYLSPPAKFYLYSYGIPYFLVESQINCNFRYAKREAFENFYPNVSDLIEFTQERNIPIKQPNTYFYNWVYSFGHSKYPYYTLPSNFDAKLWEKKNDLSNAVIYSRQDGSENDFVDPWLVYRPLDFYEFPTQYGKLVQLDGIESEQILGRFENGFTIFGAIDQIKDRVQPGQSDLGNGGVFAGRNINFNKTELGYAGTQHAAKVSCEFGHFWVDAKRGEVFHLGPNASSLTDITPGLKKWFKEHLPFKILKYFPDVDVDNTFKWFGITMGWDARLKRVFITKKDFVPKGNVCYSNGKFYATDGYEDVIANQVAQGYEYLGIENCKLSFVTLERPGTPLKLDLDEVKVSNPDYFTDCSWTVAYDPEERGWISYYSFKPNYYVSYPEYFQTGITYSDDATELGLWSHVPYISSFQVFYGKLYPWIIEFPLQSNFTDSVIHNIEYWMDVKKYYNRYDFSDIVGVSFNKAYIYNNFQNSGPINLVMQEQDNLFQMASYPAYNSDSMDVLQSETNGRFSFNDFFNRIRNERSGLPVWRYDCPQVLKEIDLSLLDMRAVQQDRLRGDYFLVRLIQDKESRYKMAFRFAVENRDFYQ